MPGFLISKVDSIAIEHSYVVTAENDEQARRLSAVYTDAAEANRTRLRLATRSWVGVA